MFWLETRDVKFGLITLAVMFALLFTGCKRRGKIEEKEVLTVELLRRLTAFFIFAGMICNCSEMLLDHFNVALDKKLAYYETRYFALIHLRLLYVLSPVFAGGSMFFAGAYCFKYPFHRCDSIKKARIGLYFLIMAFFGSFRYVICTNTPVYPYAAHVTYADLAKILMDILARPFMGVVPIIFILSMLYIILRKVIVNENVLLGLVTAASVGLSLVMFQTRVDNICWRPYAILFALGMFFVRYEEKLLRILAKLYAAVVPVTAILLCGSVFQEVMFYINRKKLRDNPFIRLAPFVDKMDYHKIIVFPYAFDYIVMFIAAVALCLLIIELAMVLDLRSPLFRIFSNFMYETASVNVIVVLIMSYTSFDFYTSASSGFAALYVIIIAVASIVAGFILYNPIRLLEKMKADS